MLTDDEKQHIIEKVRFESEMKQQARASLRKCGPNWNLGSIISAPSGKA